MKSVQCLFFVLVLPSFQSRITAQSFNEYSPDAIIEKHLEACGGRDTLNAINSVTMEGIQDYFGKMETIKTSFEKGKLNRIDIEFEGKKGWWMTATNAAGEYFPWEMKMPVIFSDTVVRAMQGNLQVNNQLLDYKEKQTEVSLLKKDTVDNRLCYRIYCVPKRGAPKRYWIDTKTFMLVQTEKIYTVRNGSADKFKAVDKVLYKNYKQVDGIAFATTEIFTTIINDRIAGVKETNYSKVEINKPLDPRLYKPE